MTRIGLISDTHNTLDEVVFAHFKNCDEIWHAGDFGSIAIANQLKEKTGLPLKGVYGNIDGQDVRSVYPEKLVWSCEGVKVFMKHIGGYPGRYAPGVKQELIDSGAKLFICGHSHILKVMYDDKIGCLHMNPGAAGNQGWHKVKTILRFVIDGDNIKDCEVIELGQRGMSAAHH
ncbi:MAG TPA: metallophosphoesterase family protein [Flavisolibacter sp.]|nr:metallophosphoesterase family protein [Flavisolibacter sp.]